MAHLKGPILISAVVCCAFLLGFQQDNLRAFFNRDTSVKVSSEAVAPQPAAVNNPPPPMANTTYLSVPFPQGNVPAKQPPPPENPYAALNKASNAPVQGQKGSLAATMDSIHSGGIQDEQVVRRNAYFEKLAEQLKELRGEAPPTVVATPTADPAAEAQPAPFAAPFPGVPNPAIEGPPLPDPGNPPFLAEPPPLPPPPELNTEDPPTLQDDPLLEEDFE